MTAPANPRRTTASFAPYGRECAARPTVAAPGVGATDWRIVLAAVVLASGAYVAWHLGRGWIAHDDGALAQSAERVLRGELPHRDFDEIYTGGLTYLNALAFRAFGTTLISLRIALFAVFLGWVPTVFYIASRFTRPLTAGLVTLMCVAWSLPNYPAAMPSWYNLFLATFGVAALFRWLEEPRTRWLAMAGVAGGLSVLVKIVGLYYVAGVLLFLVHQAHEGATRRPDGSRASQGRGYALFTSAALLLFVGALIQLVRRQMHAAELIQFVLPGIALAVLLVRNEWERPAGSSGDRFLGLARLAGPFLAGVALPVLLFLLVYAVQGGLAPLATDLFVRSARRLTDAALPMLSPWSMLALAPVAALVLYARRTAGRLPWWHLALMAVAGTGWIIRAGSVPLLYRIVWYGLRALLPALVLLGVVALARSHGERGRSPLLRAQTMLLLSVAALCSLVQFPFAGPIYFAYVAPLIVLCGVALLRLDRSTGRAVPIMGAVFLTAFAVMRVNTSPLFGMGVLYLPYQPTALIGGARASVQVPAYEAAMYRSTLATLEQHARGGYTWASPDCPELYFLSGLRNPTRTVFDFLDDDTNRTARILAALDRRGVTALVVNQEPKFSHALEPDLARELERRYPSFTTVGKFQVRWQ